MPMEIIMAIYVYQGNSSPNAPTLITFKKILAKPINLLMMIGVFTVAKVDGGLLLYIQSLVSMKKENLFYLMVLGQHQIVMKDLSVLTQIPIARLLYN